MADEPSMMQMMKQARGLQKRMGKVQKKVEKREVSAEAGGGMVEVVCSGKLEIKRVLIDAEVIAGGDKRMIQDLVTAGVNAALKKAQALVSSEMAKVAADMGLPSDETGDVEGGDDEGAGEGGRLSRWLGR